MSKEYTLAIALFLKFVLQYAGIEIPDENVSTAVDAAGVLLIAIFRQRKGDITISGRKK